MFEGVCQKYNLINAASVPLTSERLVFRRIEPALNIVICTPIARQRVGKQVPAKTDSW
jgi:hypothetical protein